ncbi:MAG: hypothetical protein M1828_000223 [Chrysothrix sp. TS-e1954]|nr:MAG: hypothetical protein M1828_000223 [Chrysothrix sp. TS-e1954]
MAPIPPKVWIFGEAKTARRLQDLVDKAAERCREQVEELAQTCRKKGIRWTDPHFTMDDENLGLDRDSARLHEILEDPQFMIEAAVSYVSGMITRLIVTQGADVGIYGFIYFTDNGVTYQIVDDIVYYKEVEDEDGDWVRELYSAKCRNRNETWITLFEKAWAKMLGSYRAISGGAPGVAMECLTGGIHKPIIFAEHRLRSSGAPTSKEDWHWKTFQENLWEQIRPADHKTAFRHLWVAHTHNQTEDWESKYGISSSHTYCVAGVKEWKGIKLVRLQDPWGRSRDHGWKGAFGDHSKEMKQECVRRFLDHDIGLGDGIFWIPFKDFLRHFSGIDRTRIDPDWYVVKIQINASLPSPSDVSPESIWYRSFKITFTRSTIANLKVFWAGYGWSWVPKFWNGLAFDFSAFASDGKELKVRRTIPKESRHCSLEHAFEPGVYNLRVSVSVQCAQVIHYHDSKGDVHKISSRAARLADVAINGLFELEMEHGRPNFRAITARQLTQGVGGKALDASKESSTWAKSVQAYSDDWSDTRALALRICADDPGMSVVVIKQGDPP